MNAFYSILYKMECKVTDFSFIIGNFSLTLHPKLDFFTNSLSLRTRECGHTVIRLYGHAVIR